MTFHARRTLGFQISTLILQECDLEEFTFFSLPDLFPRVKTLVWRSDLEHKSSYRRTSIQQFKKWKYLESIDITVTKFNIMCFLCSEPLFTKLSCLTVRYNNPYSRINYGRLDPTINRLKHIPALTSLSLDSFMVDIDFLERIHNEANNLTTLILENMILTRIGGARILLAEDGNSTLIDQDGKRIIIQPVSCLKIFKLSTRKPETNNESSLSHIKRKVTNLIQYVNTKYTHLSSITLDISNLNTYASSAARVPLEFEHNISTLISKMNCLNHFSIRLEPLSDGIRQAITENDNITLESIELWIYPTTVNFNTQLNNLTCSGFSDSLRFLKINDTTAQFHPNFSYTSAMISYLERLKNLTTLELNTTAVCGNDYSLLVNILQHMPNLDKLSIKKFTCDPIKDSTSDMETIVNSNIRHLDLGMVVLRKGVRSFINSILRFCIQSCPYLITFGLSGKLKCNWGNVNLDFRSNRYVKSVKVNVEGTVFYTFNALSFNPKDIVPYRKYGVPKLNYGSLDFGSTVPDHFRNKFFINILWSHHISLNLSPVGYY
ncbi:hypothetical protein BD770DRAFT_401008 [Pilaira anomala]|nr:hypothetical protein BD770DRAFT_401008 [Pilaira anomala]